MIDGYDDDKKMAAIGRESVRWKAIKMHKESIRDLAVALQGPVDVPGVNNLRTALNEHIDGLIEALEL